MRLRDKTALVTGGASGLGLATVRRLHHAGARVVIADLPGSRGPELATGLGESASFVAMDVTSVTSVENAFAVALARHGSVHVCVTCAGIVRLGRIVGRAGPHDPASFEAVMRVNVTGTFNVVRIAASLMARNEEQDEERGVVVMVSSIAGLDGPSGQVAYAASKAAVAGMTLPMARDLGSRKIRVVTIAPGSFETPMVTASQPEAVELMISPIAHPRRLGRPEEFAQLVHDVVENPMINGAVLRIDGGLRLT